MTLVCRFDRLAADVAHFHGVAPDDHAEACTQAPAYRVGFDLKLQDGYDVELFANLCTSHDTVARGTDGYYASWRIRNRTPLTT